MDQAINHFKDKIRHETRVYKTNISDSKLSYTDHEKGLCVGLVRGLQYCVDYLEFLKMRERESGVTEEWIEGKAIEFLDNIPQNPDRAKRYLRAFLHSLVEESRGN